MASLKTWINCRRFAHMASSGRGILTIFCKSRWQNLAAAPAIWPRVLAHNSAVYDKLQKIDTHYQQLATSDALTSTDLSIFSFLGKKMGVAKTTSILCSYILLVWATAYSKSSFTKNRLNLLKLKWDFTNFFLQRTRISTTSSKNLWTELMRSCNRVPRTWTDDW